MSGIYKSADGARAVQMRSSTRSLLSPASLITFAHLAVSAPEDRTELVGRIADAVEGELRKLLAHVRKRDDLPSARSFRRAPARPF